MVNQAVEWQLWRDVPGDVVRTFNAAAPTAYLLKKATSHFPADAGHILLKPFTGEVHVCPVSRSIPDKRWEKLARLDAVTDLSVDWQPPEDHDQWVMVKSAVTVGDVGRLARNVYIKPQELFVGKGNANPLTNVLAGSAITGLGMYGLGKLYDYMGLGKILRKLSPKYFSGRTHAAPVLGVLGAVGGALPGLWQGSIKHRQSGWPGWVTPNVKSSSVLDPVEPELPSMLRKAAEYSSALCAPIIDVKEFDNTVWQMVSAAEKRGYYIDPANNPAQNRFGVGGGALHAPEIRMDAFNRPAMFTNPQSAALASGLVHGASAMNGGSNWVSPMDVARVAVGAGAGLLSGVVAGKILGALAGLTPAAETGVQRIGLWGGALNAVKNLLTR